MASFISGVHAPRRGRHADGSLDIWLGDTMKILARRDLETRRMFEREQVAGEPLDAPSAGSAGE